MPAMPVSAPERRCLRPWTVFGPVPDRVTRLYDGVVVDPIADIPGVDGLPCGTRVNVASAITRLSHGPRGRIHFRRSKHDALIEKGGVYLFAVCSPTPARRLLALRIVRAREVDHRLGTWTERPGNTLATARLSWIRLGFPEGLRGRRDLPFTHS